MSRLGKTPISLPKGVEVKKANQTVKVKGPKGSLEVAIPEAIQIKIEKEVLHVGLEASSNLAKSMHGLYRSLIANAVIGVSSGFEKQLSLVGVGYRAAVKGNVLDLQLGFSHPCELNIPEGLEVKVEKSTLIKISGIDKRVVGQFASEVRGLHPPEPYKGKGVRYVDEQVRKKAGKAAKGK
ncbi:MAG: 50S ribosomal protein L6 [Chlamydiota bacterium]